MKLIEIIRLSECAICPYAEKKENKPLMCGWDKPKFDKCEAIKKCGSFMTEKEWRRDNNER